MDDPGMHDLFDFSWALRLVKDGEKVAREGWNGRGMWIVLRNGYPNGIGIDAKTAKETGGIEGAFCVFRPYLMMYTADGEFVPWVASQTDLLADDWYSTA